MLCLRSIDSRENSADTEMVTVIPEAEILERAALEDLHRAIPSAMISELDVQGLTIGSAFVSIAGALPPSAIVINRALGLGLTEPANRNIVSDIVSAYRASEVGRYFVQLNERARPAAVREWLMQEGLEEARGWQKFSRGTEAATPRPTALEVREAGQAEGEDFGRIVCAAFDIGVAAVPWLAQLPGRDGWHIFMSFEDGRAAGTGAMFVHRGLAWLDYAATSPEFRRRGSQGAVLAARLEKARELGCRRVYTCTGVAAPGDPQHSFHNILKSGFRTGEIRSNFAPPR